MKIRNFIPCLLFINIAITSYTAEALDFLGDLSQAIGEVSKSKGEIAKAVNDASKEKSPAPTPVAPSKVLPLPQASKTSDTESWCSDIAFKCKIKGKELIYCKNLETEDPYISITLGFDKNVSSDVSELNINTNKINISDDAYEGKGSITTAYFTDIRGTTYAISECAGMSCYLDKRYWFSEIKGTKIIKQTFCDSDSADNFNFPAEYNEKGKLVSTEKSVLTVKKSKIDFKKFYENQ